MYDKVAMDGILNINKPQGMTSYQVVSAVRRLTGARAGHAGTLDPMATGVLLVCIGRATRVVEYLVDSVKGYRAGITLGVTTDTEDAEGKILERRPVPPLTRSDVEALLRSFEGEHRQLPPFYSAVKHRGKPLYYWIRRGEQVDRKARTIYIYRLALLVFNPAASPQLVLEVRCSRGTYIRTLAVEIGRALQCGAHLSSLVRLYVGPFTLEQSCSLDQLNDASEVGRYLQPLDSALGHFPALVLADRTLQDLRNGKVVHLERAKEIEQIAGNKSKDRFLLRAYDAAGSFHALVNGIRRQEGLILKTKKYFKPERENT